VEFEVAVVRNRAARPGRTVRHRDALDVVGDEHFQIDLQHAGGIELEVGVVRARVGQRDIQAAPCRRIVADIDDCAGIRCLWVRYVEADRARHRVILDRFLKVVADEELLCNLRMTQG
jgi:hypothetical protein